MLLGYKKMIEYVKKSANEINYYLLKWNDSFISSELW